MRIGDRISRRIRQDIGAGLLLILSQGITRASLQISHQPCAFFLLLTVFCGVEGVANINYYEKIVNYYLLFGYVDCAYHSTSVLHPIFSHYH